MWAHEYYLLAAGVAYPGDGWAHDVFAGLDVCVGLDVAD